ncbi:GLPGLI family protein [Lewinella sp. IMCC34183]|uniref:GLPGLI family protein n=1 Tax=Lewinella sp. IMCC34183 TaxID=2248762 RepID=UPI001300BDCC|nr:GLPGLI family protein [Lewinella sp. IMCC34183]
MVYVLLVCFSLLGPLLSAQSTAPPVYGKITYAVVSDSAASAAFYAFIDSMRREKPEQHAMVGQDITDQFELSRTLTFELYFDRSVSIFQLVREAIPTGGKDEFTYNGAIGMAMGTVGEQRHYLNTTDSTRLTEKTLGGSSSLVHVPEPFAKWDWTITGKTKQIGNYICREATSSYSFESYKGGTVTIPVTAWFAPRLPFPYGPNGYDGLPGLILELTTGGNRVRGFRAVAIDIQPGIERALPELGKPRAVLTEDELNATAKKRMERIRRN